MSSESTTYRLGFYFMTPNFDALIFLFHVGGNKTTKFSGAKSGNRRQNDKNAENREGSPVDFFI